MSSNNQMRGFWTPLRVVATIVIFALFAAFGVSSCNSNDPITASPSVSNGGGSGRSATGPKPVTTGLASLPPNVMEAKLPAASGPSIKLSDYSGKVLLVNLWATWCGPCRMEIPELVKLNNEFQGRGVELIGLSTEDPDASAESVREFVREYNVNYHIGWATPEVALTLMQGSRGQIPQSLIITRDGRIKKRFIGYSPKITALMREALEEALADNG